VYKTALIENLKIFQKEKRELNHKTHIQQTVRQMLKTIQSTINTLVLEVEYQMAWG